MSKRSAYEQSVFEKKSVVCIRAISQKILRAKVSYEQLVSKRPVTALCWGSGGEGERFGKTSFAVGTAEGVVRVYGPA